MPVLGGDGVRVQPHPLLEQLVDTPVRQLPARSGEPVELEPELVVRQQARPPGVGVRVGAEGGERRAVVPADPGGGVRVERVAPVPHPQPEPLPRPQDAERQDDAAGQRLPGTGVGGGVGGGVEGRLEPRLGQLQLRTQLLDREGPVGLQLRLELGGVGDEVSPGPRPGHERAGQRGRTGLGDVAGRDLGVPGQRAEHRGVRRQQQRARRRTQLRRHPLQRGGEVVGHPRLVVGHRCLAVDPRLVRPARHPGGPTGQEHPGPEGPRGLLRPGRVSGHLVVTTVRRHPPPCRAAHVRSSTTPVAGSPREVWYSATALWVEAR